MQIYLIRHGQTAGNALRRYIGSTDQPLTPEGAEGAKAAGARRSVRSVFVTPLVRTQQTARILFPDAEQTVVPALREMDFGDFEDRSFEDMKDDPAYRAWVDGGCLAPCPNGESVLEFSNRVYAGFLECVRALPEETRRAVFVVHGGTIMALMSRLARPKIAYFDAFAANCGGYACRLSMEEGKPVLLDARRFERLPEELS